MNIILVREAVARMIRVEAEAAEAFVDIRK